MEHLYYLDFHFKLAETSKTIAQGNISLLNIFHVFEDLNNLFYT